MIGAVFGTLLYICVMSMLVSRTVRRCRTKNK